MEETHTKRIKWTKELCAEEALKYPTRRQFQKGCQRAYQKAYKEKWLDEICAHMTSPHKPSGYWTYERCLEEAKKHKNRWAFQSANPTAYQKAIRMGWIEKICLHMRKVWKTTKELTFEQCLAEALQYETRTDFKRKASGAYVKACREHWLDKVCAHMKPKKVRWTKKECAKMAAMFTKRSYFYKHNSSAFNAAKRNGWLDEICAHMVNNKKNTNSMEKNTEKIKLKELEKWLVDYITDTIHSLKTEDNEEFNKWAQSFERDEAEFVVGMEFCVDWGEERRRLIPIEEAMKYANVLLQKIVDVWYL